MKQPTDTLKAFGAPVIVAVFAATTLAQSGSPGSSSATSTASDAASDIGAPEKRPAVVVELFTSQGCNSCPPADAALRQIAAVANKNELPVYAISFHVDYWNRLGWTDPYSHASYSKRQGSYAAAAGSRRVYTPQMIVNGTTEFVGSDKAKAHQAITTALKQAPTTGVSLQVDNDSKASTVSIAYQVSGMTTGRVLNIAIVQTPPANEVPKGENAGRTLSHVNVVRAFKTLPLDQPAGRATLQLPPGVSLEGSKVIGYVQDAESRAISGASSINAG